MSRYYKSAVIPWQDWNQFLTVSDTGQVLNLESSQIVSSQQKTPDSIIESLPSGTVRNVLSQGAPLSSFRLGKEQNWASSASSLILASSLLSWLGEKRLLLDLSLSCILA